MKSTEKYKTIIEPHRVKVVEPLRMTTAEERRQKLEAAGFNLFGIAADDVLIDLLTDSGTSAMSAAQWAGLQIGDESYAGSRSFFGFEKEVRELCGYAHVIPTHQGRAAERILFASMLKEGDVVPGNTHFDTTRANIEFAGATALDIPIVEGTEPSTHHPFKGNIDNDALEKILQGSAPVPMVMVTVTNNSGGGQPVSMENLKKTRELCNRFEVPLYLDAARFAENAYFIKLREPGYQDKSAAEIAREMYALSDGCTMSAKKDGLANIGGFIGTHNDELAARMRNLLILTEGFPTYGGLAGRDLEAIRQGLREVLDEGYLDYRIGSTAYLGERISNAGIPIVQPPGGHAIYIDAKALLPHIPPLAYPGQALACELYRAGGIRSCELGSVMFGRRDPETGKESTAAMELVRLALPRRVYTQSHVDYVIEVIVDIGERRDTLRGFKIVEQAPLLRHFTARFAPL